MKRKAKVQQKPMEAKKNSSSITESIIKEYENAPKLVGWEAHETVIIKKYNDFKGAKTIISFDLDDTLIASEVKKKKDKSSNEGFSLLYKKELMLDRINQFIEKEKASVAIFSNQNGIEAGKINENEFKQKIDKLFNNELKFPCVFFAAKSKDYYRKPSIGMLELFEEKYNDGIKIDRDTSIFVGDAAGRKKGKDHPKNDFSDSDYKFALNIKFNFKTPEEFFLNQPQAIPKIESTLHLYDNNDNSHIKFDDSKQEMIILVGSPGSGKSTYCSNELTPRKYIRINQDSLKTEKNCIQKAKEELEKGSSVVIDNTNGKKAKREIFIALAKERKIPVRCFIMKVEKDLAFHLNHQREINREREHFSGAVNNIPIHSFFKYYEEPKKEEGYEEIVEVKFVPGPFKSEKEKEIFYMVY